MNLPKAYEAAKYEKDIYMMWEKANAFAPNLEAPESFSVTMPPPNATWYFAPWPHFDVGDSGYCSSLPEDAGQISALFAWHRSCCYPG